MWIVVWLSSLGLSGAGVGKANPTIPKDCPSIQIAAKVEVRKDRFTLGEMAQLGGADRALLERLARIEVGASPLPGQSRVLNRLQVETRLRQHGFQPETLRLEMPATVQIVRRAQQVEPERILKFARDQLRLLLEEEAETWQLEKQPPIPPLPEGTLSLKPEGEPFLGMSQARVGVLLLVDDQVRGRLTFLFRAPPRSRQLLIKSGEPVTVQVQVGALLVEATGTARASGAQNEIIPVYLKPTQKTIRARIIEKGLVKVEP